MPTLDELARLGKQALLTFLAPLLTELAALRARVEGLLAENAALRAQLDRLRRDSRRQAAPFSKGQREAQPKRPGRKPGQGRFTFRTLPGPDQWTAPPIEVRLPDPVCPCCGEPLHENRVDLAAVTDLPPPPSPIVKAFQVRARHRNEEVREVIGDDYPGVLVTDRGRSYDAKELEAVRQQKCISHALRSINEVLETKRGRARHFGARLKDLLKEGLQLWHESHDHRGP